MNFQNSTFNLLLSFEGFTMGTVCRPHRPCKSIFTTAHLFFLCLSCLPLKHMRLLLTIVRSTLFGCFVLRSTAVVASRNQPPRRDASFSKVEPFLLPRTTTTTTTCASDNHQNINAVFSISRGGGWFFPPGWNPFGYKLTSLGEEFLKYDGSINSDVGRFLAGLKQRKRFYKIKEQWLEILRVSKSGQSMRIYKQVNELIAFCLKANLID
jgi:hypothetical protein